MIQRINMRMYMDIMETAWRGNYGWHWSSCCSVKAKSFQACLPPFSMYLCLSRISFNWEKHVQKVYLTLEQPNILVPSLLNNAPPCSPWHYLVDFAFRSRRNSSSTISLLRGYLHHNRISSQTLCIAFIKIISVLKSGIQCCIISTIPAIF